MLFYKSNDYRSKQLCKETVDALSLNGVVIDKVNSFKYLGVHLDSNLQMNIHFRHVENRMNAALSRMYSLRSIMTKNVLKTMLSAFVISILDFCLIIWNVQTAKETKRLQNKINRFVLSFFAKKMAKKEKQTVTINELFLDLDLYTIAERKTIMLVKFVYKFKDDKLFKSWFSPSYCSTENRPTFQPLTVQTEMLKKSVQYNAIIEWNSFVKETQIIWTDITADSFADKIKEYLLNFRSDIYVYK